MLDEKTIFSLQKILNSFKEVIAVYMFGSYLTMREQARDVDLAVLLHVPLKSMANIYTDMYSRLAEIFYPLEVDLLFLNSASLPVRFEVITSGVVIYCSDDDLRTDFEYLTSGIYMDYRYHLETGRNELYELIKEGSFPV